MSEKRVPPRSEIPAQYTWNAPSVFPSEQAWEAEVGAIASDLPELSAFQGRLHESPAILLAALQCRDRLARRAMIVAVYAGMSAAVDTTDPHASAMQGQAQSLLGRLFAGAAFISPELIAVGQARLQEWMAVEAGLQPYAHAFEELFHRQAHIRSGEVEELLGMLEDPFASIGNTATKLTDADFQFKAALSATGAPLPLTQGTWQAYLSSPDRELRRSTWENFMDQHLAYQNTLANNLLTSVKVNVFKMHARRHASTLEASLFDNHIPVEVFHNLLETFRKNLPTWHRYWRLRKQALGVTELQPYDTWAPLGTETVPVSFEQAVEWICAGVSPLGADYAETVRRACLEERWVDVYPNLGKGGGAFSYGAPGTYPFINMSFNDDINGLSTLAHELGHSMHSYLTWQNQPQVYSDYSLFVAEVASNFHQALVRQYLFQTRPERNFQLALLDEAMNNFHRYFFLMPTLARFELEVHRRVERGQGVTAQDMNALMADLFEEGYGGEMVVQRDRVGITWATFGHLYADYYVYQYATGISGANALARRVLAGGAAAAADYRQFLSAGSSLYPLQALQLAGVDLSTPQPVEETFGVLAELVDRLETLTAPAVP